MIYYYYYLQRLTVLTLLLDRIVTLLLYIFLNLFTQPILPPTVYFRCHWSLDEVYLGLTALVRLSRDWPVPTVRITQIIPSSSLLLVRERERERMTQRARAEKKKYRKGWKQLHWAGTGQLSEEDGNESCCSYSPLIMNILYWLDWFPPPPFTKCHIVKMEEKGSKVASVAVAVADQLWMSECPGWLSCRMARSAFCHSE